MPIYEYQCNACGYQLEKLQKASAEPLKECPKCGKLELQKLISQTSFKLTGSGWYETDFKNKGGAKPESKSDQATNKVTTDKAEKTSAKPSVEKANSSDASSSKNKE